jgi:hypothetical protein
MSGANDDKSTGYKIMDSDTLITKLDINVGHCSTVQNICINSKEYKVNSVYGVIADKLSAIYSRKLFRRIKDLYDVYVLISNFDFDLSHIYNTLELKHRFLEDNRYIYGIEQVTGNDDNLYDLKHAWCATVDKISYIPVTFDDCYNKVLQFIFPITSGVRENLYWNHLTAVWIYTVCSGSIDEEINLFN